MFGGTTPIITIDRLWHDCRLATLSPSSEGLGQLDNGVVACTDGRIVYAGSASDASSSWSVKERIGCGGRWITPGLIDCHTHLVHGGNRSREFEQRLRGATYEEIARAGGGILSTVDATRRASTEELVAGALPRLDALIAEGVTTIEIKSGYGLEFRAERRQLRAARQLGVKRPICVRTTLLAAHTVPPEYAGNRSGYIDAICDEYIPRFSGEGLLDSVDAFCEEIAFSPQEVSRVFEKCAVLGIPVKLHADQLSNLHGAALAARFDALSADHLEYADEQSVAAMASSGTVAVLLPGAFYFIREQQMPPVDLMRRYGVPIALATDSNPGTSPLTSILLTMNMGATLFRLTVDECIAGVTREAARALGLFADVGSLEVGKYCDLAIWDIERPADLVYRIGFNPLRERVWRGMPRISTLI